MEQQRTPTRNPIETTIIIDLQQRRTQATKPVPGWLAVLSGAALFGAILWTMFEVGFRMKGW